MEIIIGFFIFCLVLFIYLHIQFHLKTGEDLEMYEVDETSKEKLEEICDIRQPVLFEFDNTKIIENTNKTYIANNYYAFETKVRNKHENRSHSSSCAGQLRRLKLELASEAKYFHITDSVGLDFWRLGACFFDHWLCFLLGGCIAHTAVFPV
jgi:hypothetical protein